jgi:hypothetical protein
MFDIAQKETALAIEDEGLTFQLLDENDEPAVEDGKPVTWTVCGMNSRQYRKAEAWQRKQFQMLAGRKQTGDQQLLMQSEFVARCSLGFSDNFADNGVPLPFTTENAAKILSRLPFVQKQVEQAIGDRARFLARTSNNSPSVSATTPG